jgi:TRAP-type C4-dicarboxylate transport system substrate-binding protein
LGYSSDNFYFGTRQLTCDRAIKKPEDLNKIKIRAIPFPIYMTAVEGLGAVATPVNWSEVPTALATGIVNGQENPVDVIYQNKLYDLQSHLMLTGHIMAAQSVVINEKVWQNFSPEIQKQIMDAVQEVSKKATQMTLDREAENLANIKKAGMTVIGSAEGLKVELFRKRTQKLVAERFDKKYGDLYYEIREIK